MKPLKLITILGIAILISLPSLAFAKGGKPPKDDPPVPAVEYSVALTTGVFTFSHNATLNSRGYLKSLDTEPLVFDRPSGPDDVITDEQAAWDAVIDNCD